MLARRTVSAQVKLADFGLAVQITPGEKLKDGVGTPNFIAPEVLQCLEDEDEAEGYDFGCDMWSAGCILFILLGGKFPFGHIEDTDEMYDAIMAGRFSMDATEWGAVSSEAKDLVRCVMAADPDKRLQCEQVLGHEWMESSALEGKALAGTQAELKNLNAKKRWKSSILAVMATNRVKTLVDMRGVAERRRNK